MGTFQYEVDGKPVVLKEEEHLLAVRFKEPAKHSTRNNASKSAGVQRFDERVELPNESFTIVDLRPSAKPQPGSSVAAEAPRPATIKASLENDASVERVSSVFSLGTTRVIATDRVLVGLHASADAAAIAHSVHGKIIESNEGEHVIELEPQVDPLEVATQLAARADVEYAEPDFVNVVPKLARRPAPNGAGPLDPLDSQQYALTITKAVDAWNRTKGRSEIRIAILDEGVDTYHQDLAAAIVGSYDSADNDTYQEPNPWDGHGTACAGLAAAIHNSVGVRGVGGGCSLLAVRIAYSDMPGGGWVITNSGVRRAIDWSWRNGADVLSNSWGGGAPSNSVARAFARAGTLGRNGKGSVVVIAAGNENDSVTFPAILPGVICVSASNQFDEPKTKTSHDGESWWGSCFGPEVTVAAPGVRNYTTDITGTGGYSRGPFEPNYTPNFNGTSSSTPIVAGAVGLMLSANPALTAADVRRILIETADKVGAVQYDANGHNPRMGYGRLNVDAAVERAFATA